MSNKLYICPMAGLTIECNYGCEHQEPHLHREECSGKCGSEDEIYSEGCVLLESTYDDIDIIEALECIDI